MSIEVRSLVKSFGSPPADILKEIDLEIRDGDFFSITGRSGSGKSTLLYIIACLDLPTRGLVKIDDKDIGQMSSADLHRFRNSQMGFVFQFHYLLPELTAIENVLMPARKAGLWEERKPKASDLLKSFGLEHRLDHRPSELSGGEQQRVAIARALVMEPRYLFADEPTGNLDSVNGDTVMEILQAFNRDEKMTVVYVTHDEGYAQRANRRIHLVDGRVQNP